jgi:hypothetical protein
MTDLALTHPGLMHARLGLEWTGEATYEAAETGRIVQSFYDCMTEDERASALRSIYAAIDAASPLTGEDLVGPHRLASAKGPSEGELPEETSRPSARRTRTAAGRSSGDCSGARRLSTVLRVLPVEGRRSARHGVEDRHVHGRGVQQRLRIGPGPPLLPVPAGVGDDLRQFVGFMSNHHITIIPKSFSVTYPSYLLW